MDTVNTTVPAMDSSLEMPCGVLDSQRFIPEIYSERELRAKLNELEEESRKTQILSIQPVNEFVDLRNTGLNNCNVLLLDIKEAFKILAEILNGESLAEEIIQALKSLIEYNDLFLAMITTEAICLDLIKLMFEPLSIQHISLSSADKDLLDALGSLNSSIKLILAEQKTQKSLIIEIQGASSTIFEKISINHSAVQELVDALKSLDASINQIAEEMAQKTFLAEMNTLLDSILSQQVSLETRLTNLDIAGFTDVNNPSNVVQQQTSHDTIAKQSSKSRDAIMTNLKVSDTEEKKN